MWSLFSAMPVRCANSSKWYVVQNVQRPRTKRAKQSCKQTHKVQIHLKMKYFGFAQSLALCHSNTLKCSNKNPLHVIFRAALGSNCRTMSEPSWTCVQVMWALWFLAALPPLAWFLLLPGRGGNLCLGRIQPARSQVPGKICQSRNHTTAGRWPWISIISTDSKQKLLRSKVVQHSDQSQNCQSSHRPAGPWLWILVPKKARAKLEQHMNHRVLLGAGLRFQFATCPKKFTFSPGTRATHQNFQSPTSSPVSASSYSWLP